MNTVDCIKTLIQSEDIPQDSEVVSTNNKVVIISRSEKLVARIGSVTDAVLRDDPHDLRYSHTVSWLAGAVAPVVKPLQEHPVVRAGYVISSYPLLDSGADLRNAKGIYAMVRGLGDSLDVVRSAMELKTVNVSSYVTDRLNTMQGDSRFDGRLVDYVCS